MTRWLRKLFSRDRPVPAIPEKSAVQTTTASAALHSSLMQRRLGNDFLAKDDLKAATACYERAVALDARSVDALTSLGYALKESGELARAQQHLARACDLDPGSFDATYLLGQVLNEQHLAGPSVAALEKASQLRPEFEPLYAELCQAHLKAGSVDTALQVIQSGIRKFPANSTFQLYAGNLFLESGHADQALVCYRKAEAINPNDPGVQNSLATALAATGQLLEAEGCLRSALAVEPASATFLANLGGVLLRQGRVSEAISQFRSARNADPLFMPAHQNLLFALSIEQTSTNRAYLEEAAVFRRSIEKLSTAAYNDWPAIDFDIHPRPLRVGFVSGNFHANPVGFFLESTLARLKSIRVELIAYATSTKVDALTQRIRPAFTHWVDGFGMDDAALAKKIHSDGIHILVDLNGHSDGNRLPVFALKPAPLQVSWLGYWASTGLQEIDYVLMDEVSLPAHDQHQFLEAVHYLPGTRLCFTPPEPELAVSPLPALRNGHITFGCFQVLTKVNDAVLALWGRVLKAVPHSRLRLASNQSVDAALRQRLDQRLAAAGIDCARVTLVGRVAREQYLHSYGEVDFVLDTFPFTGGTTSCEALWMGVPTLTMTGNTLIARQGASMMGCVGLTDWIAVDEADYLNKAVRHAADPHALHLLRASLRKRTLSSPLFDAERFAGHLEQAFLDMWHQKYPSVKPQA